MQKFLNAVREAWNAMIGPYMKQSEMTSPACASVIQDLPLVRMTSDLGLSSKVARLLLLEWVGHSDRQSAWPKFDSEASVAR